MCANVCDQLLFGFTNNAKNSFTCVRKEVGLPDIRFHDLRHTAATRLVAAHLPLPEVGRVLGHTQANTTYRYVKHEDERAWIEAHREKFLGQWVALDGGNLVSHEMLLEYAHEPAAFALPEVGLEVPAPNQSSRDGSD